MEILAADLMAPTASTAQVKLRDAAWAKATRSGPSTAARTASTSAARRPERTRAKEAKDETEWMMEAEEGPKRRALRVCQAILLEYDQDAAGLASSPRRIAEEAEKPTIEALARSGIASARGKLGTAASWAMLMWFAAQACRKQLGDASLDTMDAAARSAFL